MTLVEILIVVIILGILAQVVIPQLGRSSTDASTSAIATDLQTIRSQLEVYKAQHLGKYPHEIAAVGTDSDKWIAQLTNQTDRNGNIMPAGGNAASYPFGPYLKKFPANEIVNDSTISSSVKFGSTATSPNDGTTGWYVSTTTGQFQTNNSSTSGTNASATVSKTTNNVSNTSAQSTRKYVTPVRD